jgi:hypothetical protein
MVGKGSPMSETKKKTNSRSNRKAPENSKTKANKKAQTKKKTQDNMETNTGGESGASDTALDEENIVELPSGEGATRLRSAINSLVGAKSDKIAKALVEKTLKGNMTSAKLVVELADGKAAGKKDVKKKRRGPSTAQLLASEPEWQDTLAAGAGISPAAGQAGATLS